MRQKGKINIRILAIVPRRASDFKVPNVAAKRRCPWISEREKKGEEGHRKVEKVKE